MWWLKINEKSNSIHLRYLFNRSVVGSLCVDCSWLLFQAMVTNVSSLLKTVKSVEDKTLRGTRALESTTDAVKQAVLVSVFCYVTPYNSINSVCSPSPVSVFSGSICYLVTRYLRRGNNVGEHAPFTRVFIIGQTRQ